MQAAYRRRREGGAHDGLRAHAAAHPRAEVALRPTAATGAVGNSEPASPGWECVKPKQAETVP